MLSILRRIKNGEWQLINSEVIEVELARLPNLEKLASIRQLLDLATTKVILDTRIDQRSKVLENLGFGLYDSFHIACSEATQTDILLTTDDRLLKRATRYQPDIQVKISNPVIWLMKTVLTSGE